MIEEFEKFICSPGGEILRLDGPFHLNLIQWHYLKRVPDFYQDYFECFIDWPSFEREIEAILESGKDPWRETFFDCPNTSINLFYARGTFLVDSTEYTRLNSSFGGLLVPEEYGYPFDEKTVQDFSGWSLCLRDADVSSITRESVKTTFFKIMFEAVFGWEAYNEFESLRETKTNVGRPQKKLAAAEAYLRHFDIDQKPNWKLVQRVLLEKEGLDVSPKTIKRGLSEMAGDQNEEDSGQKSGQ